MSKSRLGKSRDSIFAQSKSTATQDNSQDQEEEQPEESKLKQTRGRPQEHKEGWTKVTVVLLDKQIHWLDNLASDIRLKTKSAVSRAEIIRAMIAAIEESGLDLSDTKSEIEAKIKILNQMKK